MRRREFIMLLSCAAAIWPLAARAQQPERVRRVGVLVGLAENDPEMKERIAGLRQGLEKLGWVEGSNLRIDYRFAPAGAQARLLARELIDGCIVRFGPRPSQNKFVSQQQFGKHS